MRTLKALVAGFVFLLVSVAAQAAPVTYVLETPGVV